MSHSMCLLGKNSLGEWAYQLGRVLEDAVGIFERLEGSASIWRGILIRMNQQREAPERSRDLIWGAGPHRAVQLINIWLYQFHEPARLATLNFESFISGLKWNFRRIMSIARHQD